MGVELRILSSWSRRPIGARGFPPVEQRLWESLELWHSLEFFFFFSFSHNIFEFHKFSRQSCRRKLKYFLAIFRGPWRQRCFIFFFKQIKAEKFLLIQNRIRTNPAWLPVTSPESGLGSYQPTPAKTEIISGENDFSFFFLFHVCWRTNKFSPKIRRR